ncbi:MAG: hypothetical protein LBI69_04555 [Puniceicoccales bacterium]|nr:hypothetical protein [Puniceicoccales bacterium]
MSILQSLNIQVPQLFPMANGEESFLIGQATALQYMTHYGNIRTQCREMLASLNIFNYLLVVKIYIQRISNENIPLSSNHSLEVNHRDSFDALLYIFSNMDPIATFRIFEIDSAFTCINGEIRKSVDSIGNVQIIIVVNSGSNNTALRDNNIQIGNNRLASELSH